MIKMYLIAIVAIATLGLAVIALWLERRRKDAYIYVPPNVALTSWQYKQLPMKDCAFCKTGVNLNRHHVIPQLAAPERKNDPTNLIVLCRSCHQVIGHKNNFRKFNPYVSEICKKYGGAPVDSIEWKESQSKQSNMFSNVKPIKSRPKHKRPAKRKINNNSNY